MLWMSSLAIRRPPEGEAIGIGGLCCGVAGEVLLSPQPCDLRSLEPMDFPISKSLFTLILVCLSSRVRYIKYFAH